jgi:stage II sporulation protein D
VESPKAPAPSTPSHASLPEIPAQNEETASAPSEIAAAPSTESAAGPFIRVGLTTAAKEIRVSSSGDFYFMEKIPEASRQLVQGEIQVRIERDNAEAASVYQIQVASYTKRENAEELREKLAGKFDVPVAISENGGSGSIKVRVGSFSAKEDAQDFLKTVTKSGYRDAFIVKETTSSGSGKLVLALRGPNNLFQLSQAGFLLIPSSGTSFLCIDGKPYRGSFDIILNKNGRITVVNQLGMEDYLLGVVPAELNPSSYPEYAALAAQSIAARTYALRNMGRYRSDGFDLSDDTNTQVYSGVAAEKSATNEAVRQTQGLAIYYQDKLINAMYMSTCGGRTEDFSNVFDAPPVPYLKSIVCAIDSGPEKGEIIIEGHHELDQEFLADDGSLANRDIEFARVLGLIGPDSKISPEFLAGNAEQKEVLRWIETAKKLSSKAPGNLPKASNIGARSGFLQYAAESFFGADEIRRKIAARDVEYYLGNLKDGSSVPEPARFALAFLMQSGLWRPYSDNTFRPEDPMRRGDAISLDTIRAARDPPQRHFYGRQRP